MLKKLIEDKLKATQDCHFKKAFIPKGWACVNIKKFAEELADEVNNYIFSR